jgi:DNA-binding response OmpR family regulator
MIENARGDSPCPVLGSAASTPIILVVDDEPEILLSLDQVLTRAGYLVRTAGNIYEALETVSCKTPDVVIADLWLPDEGGWSLWEMLSARAAIKPERFFLLTALGSEESVMRRAEAEGLRVIGRPFDPDELVRIVRSALTSSKPRVLVVEDNEGMREVLKEFLVTYGFEAVLASNGAEALEHIRTTQIDVVAIDLHLPNVPGTALWERIRQEAPHLAARTVFVTATPEEIERNPDLPCPIVAKPFDHAHLAQVLRGLLIPLT